MSERLCRAGAALAAALALSGCGDAGCALQQVLGNEAGRAAACDENGFSLQWSVPTDRLWRPGPVMPFDGKIGPPPA